MVVNDDEFLPPPPGMMLAVREADLKKLQEETVVTFPKTKLAELVLGQMCYCIFKVQSTNWGYLSVVEKIEGKKVHVRVTTTPSSSKQATQRRRSTCLTSKKKKMPTLFQLLCTRTQQRSRQTSRSWRP